MSAKRDKHRKPNYFGISASGKTFDVDHFFRGTELPIDHVWRRGEPRPKCVAVNDKNGIYIELGDGAEWSVQEQQEIGGNA